MPGFDRKGPRGTGPMTGGRRGLCGSRNAGSRRFDSRRGFGRGMGFNRGQGAGREVGFGFGPGRGFRRRAWGPAYYCEPKMAAPPTDREQNIDFLQNQAQSLKEELDDIEARISEMKKEEN